MVVSREPTEGLGVRAQSALSRFQEYYILQSGKDDCLAQILTLPAEMTNGQFWIGYDDGIVTRASGINFGDWPDNKELILGTTVGNADGSSVDDERIVYHLIFDEEGNFLPDHSYRRKNSIPSEDDYYLESIEEGIFLLECALDMYGRFVPYGIQEGELEDGDL